MAEFCTKCSEELFGKEVEPEIDIEKTVNELKPDTYVTVLCEGCGMTAIGKDKSGEVYVAIADSTIDEHVEPGFHYVRWITLDEHQQLNINH